MISTREDKLAIIKQNIHFSLMDMFTWVTNTERRMSVINLTVRQLKCCHRHHSLEKDSIFMK